MKHQYNKFFIYTFLILFISSCKDEIEDVLPLEATQFLNVSYGDSPQQKYDIYLPYGRTKETTKVFVLVHGGSWIGGDKSDMNFMVDALKQRFPEHAIVNINYQLAGLGNPPLPMQINDIESIITDLENTKIYQIDDDYGFIGVSAGAHLSMLYSYAYDTSSNVEMVCSIVGPTNFTDPNYITHPSFISLGALFGLVYDSSNPKPYEDMSPYHVVTAAAPPSILFYGDQDHLIPTSQGVDMSAKLDALGVVNEFTLYEGEGHAFTAVNAIDTNLKLTAFIGAHFD
ncbi:MAG: alpha/beta hydrolase [Flavobacteriaceae bacterium]|nr:alpha/beta hydrolase [Flavobacteriaceae bacterium]